MSIKKSYISPAALLQELGITEPQDIDIEAIAQYCGATIVYESLHGCEAQIVGKENRAIIAVRKDSPRPRQRFSGAHELGHWMCDRGRAAFACIEKTFLREWSKDNPETRANRYAADLLLPRHLFEREARGKAMTLVTARELADRYQASLTATTIRLVELGSFPAMVVCMEQGRRKWFMRGSDVPNSLWPVENLQRGSLAYELMEGGKAVGPIDVEASNWIDHPDAERFPISEDSLRSGDFVLSLLWWKDERQLLELEQ
jgi:Zn-dependent peptidase ImmA (M78 family)